MYRSYSSTSRYRPDTAGGGSHRPRGGPLGDVVDCMKVMIQLESDKIDAIRNKRSLMECVIKLQESIINNLSNILCDYSSNQNSCEASSIKILGNEAGKTHAKGFDGELKNLKIQILPTLKKERKHLSFGVNYTRKSGKESGEMKKLLIPPHPCSLDEKLEPERHKVSSSSSVIRSKKESDTFPILTKRSTSNLRAKSRILNFNNKRESKYIYRDHLNDKTSNVRVESSSNINSPSKNRHELMKKKSKLSSFSFKFKPGKKEILLNPNSYSTGNLQIRQNFFDNLKKRIVEQPIISMEVGIDQSVRSTPMYNSSDEAWTLSMIGATQHTHTPPLTDRMTVHEDAPKKSVHFRQATEPRPDKVRTESSIDAGSIRKDRKELKLEERKDELPLVHTGNTGNTAKNRLLKTAYSIQEIQLTSKSSVPSRQRVTFSIKTSEEPSNTPLQIATIPKRHRLSKSHNMMGSGLVSNDELPNGNEQLIHSNPRSQSNHSQDKIEEKNSKVLSRNLSRLCDYGDMPFHPSESDEFKDEITVVQSKIDLEEGKKKSKKEREQFIQNHDSNGKMKGIINWNISKRPHQKVIMNRELEASRKPTPNLAHLIGMMECRELGGQERNDHNPRRSDAKVELLDFDLWRKESSSSSCSRDGKNSFQSDSQLPEILYNSKKKLVMRK